MRVRVLLALGVALCAGCWTYATHGYGLSDRDADGLSDAAEINVYRTYPDNRDSDGDTISDGDEVSPPDPAVPATNPMSPDTDCDGFDDAEDDDPVTADAKPRIYITSPWENQIFATSTLIVKGVAKNDDHPTSLTVKVYVGGRPAMQTVTSGVEFTVLFYNVPDGHHTVKAEVIEDGMRRNESDPLKIWVDTQPPTIGDSRDMDRYPLYGMLSAARELPRPNSPPAPSVPSPSAGRTGCSAEATTAAEPRPFS